MRYFEQILAIIIVVGYVSLSLAPYLPRDTLLDLRIDLLYCYSNIKVLEVNLSTVSHKLMKLKKFVLQYSQVLYYLTLRVI